MHLTKCMCTNHRLFLDLTNWYASIEIYGRAKPCHTNCSPEIPFTFSCKTIAIFMEDWFYHRSLFMFKSFGNSETQTDDHFYTKHYWDNLNVLSKLFLILSPRLFEISPSSISMYHLGPLFRYLINKVIISGWW